MRCGVAFALILPMVASLALLTSFALADPPLTSPWPVPRPGQVSASPGLLLPAPLLEEAPLFPAGPIRPMPRATPQALAAEEPLSEVWQPNLIRPMPRPAGLGSTAVAEAAPQMSQPAKGAKNGAVCGDSQIRGQVLETIKSSVKGCGVEAPVKVTSISGVTLNPPPTIDCTTAEALKTWIRRGLQPAFGRREVVEMKIAASYICRPRNNVKGARISEHGRGKAIDIAGFVLDNGRTYTVEDDYNRQIRKAQKAACGIFGTTLGPGSDGYHENHLHFDTASYSGGPYCR